jgi:hypothetical protein
MTPFCRFIFLALLVLVFGATEAMAQSVEFRLRDGTRFRGQIDDRLEVRTIQQGVEITVRGRLIAAEDMHITLEVDMAGTASRRPVFISEILSIRKLDEDGREGGSTPGRDDRPGRGGQSPRAPASENESETGMPGVIVLPLEGGVGQEIRVEEFEALRRYADSLGPGQIIVFDILTPGGSVVEMEMISAALIEMKKKHRLIAWVREAISAGCYTIIHCDEIYFTSYGAAGAMTPLRGDGSPVEPEKLQHYVRVAGDMTEVGGRSRYIGEAMVEAKRAVSYDVDPVTGKRTFYPNTRGKYILSRPGENLVFNADNAVHSGFAQGVANTTDELAKLLDMPQWNEVSDYGRRIASDWQRTWQQINRDLIRLQAQLGYKGTGGGDAKEIISHRIRILTEIVRLLDRAPNMLRGGSDPREPIQRQIRELQKQLADMERAERQQRRRR